MTRGNDISDDVAKAFAGVLASPLRLHIKDFLLCIVCCMCVCLLGLICLFNVFSVTTCSAVPHNWLVY